MTFSAKKLKHVKICLLHCKKLFISLEEIHFPVLSFALKIAFSNFFLTEKKFWAFVALHSPNLLSCTKHRIGVLRSSKEVICAIKSKWLFLQKSSNTENLSSALQKTFISLEIIFLCSWALLLKLHLALFLTEKEAFEHLWPRILIICLVCTKHRIGVLRSSKEVLLCN